MNDKTFYVTTPIYYVNDKPHIGHAYTTILADVLARYHRLLGDPTFFLTGTDEHGQKVQQAADANSITPKEQCDRTVVRFQELWERLDITNDDFIRTTEERHKRVVQAILQDLFDRDEIYADEYEGWYCVPCERFFTEKDLVDGTCPECRRNVDKLSERNYFFRMSKYQDWLIEHIEANPGFIQPAHRRQETLGFLRQPLGDLCVSRPKNRLAWGIELPFDKDYVTYVWFDALVNYISAIGFAADSDRFETWWPASYHLIGKDILTTHTVYWPTMLKAIGVAMPEAVFAHGWWLVGRDKMSKSVGNVVNPMEMVDRYGVDAFRYFLMAEMTLGQDASFTEDAFVSRYNSDLANDLMRTALGAVQHMRDYLDAMQLDRGIAETLGAVRAGNRYFDKMKPWALAKSGASDELSRVLYNAAECLRIVSGLLFPVMPDRMLTLRRALGVAEEQLVPQLDNLEQWGGLAEGAAVQDIDSLFPRVKPAENANAPAPSTQKKPAESTKGAKAADNATGAGVALISFDTFQKVELKTARILSAEPVEGADKLLKLMVQIGAEKRRLVAGIARHYKPAELLDKTVVVVANLKPAKIFGVESNGMLLAAKKDDRLELVTVDGDIGTGASVG
jgi:methionyl-tRNA synthetase